MVQYASDMPDFKAVKVSEVVQYACGMPDFKAVKASVVKWYNMLVTCQTSRQ